MIHLAVGHAHAVVVAHQLPGSHRPHNKQTLPGRVPPRHPLVRRRTQPRPPDPTPQCLIGIAQQRLAADTRLRRLIRSKHHLPPPPSAPSAPTPLPPDTRWPRGQRRLLPEITCRLHVPLFPKPLEPRASVWVQEPGMPVQCSRRKLTFYAAAVTESQHALPVPAAVRACVCVCVCVCARAHMCASYRSIELILPLCQHHSIHPCEKRHTDSNLAAYWPSYTTKPHGALSTTRPSKSPHTQVPLITLKSSPTYSPAPCGTPLSHLCVSHLC